MKGNVKRVMNNVMICGLAVCISALILKICFWNAMKFC